MRWMLVVEDEEEKKRIHDKLDYNTKEKILVLTLCCICCTCTAGSRKKSEIVSEGISQVINLFRFSAAAAAAIPYNVYVWYGMVCLYPKILRRRVV